MLAATHCSLSQATWTTCKADVLQHCRQQRCLNQDLQHLALCCRCKMLQLSIVSHSPTDAVKCWL